MSLYSSDLAMSGIWRALIIEPVLENNLSVQYRLYIPALHKDRIPFSFDDGVISGKLKTSRSGYYMDESGKTTNVKKSDFPVSPVCCWGNVPRLTAGDSVWIMFENSNCNYPVIIGTLGDKYYSDVHKAISGITATSKLFGASAYGASGLLMVDGYPLGIVCFAFETAGGDMNRINCWMTGTLNDGAGKNYGLMSANRSEAVALIDYIKDNSDNFRNQIGSKQIFTEDFDNWWRGTHSEEDTTEMLKLQSDFAASRFLVVYPSSYSWLLNRSRAIKEMIISRNVQQGAYANLWSNAGIDESMSDEEIIEAVYDWCINYGSYGEYTQDIRTNRLPREKEMVLSFLNAIPESEIGSRIMSYLSQVGGSPAKNLRDDSSTQCVELPLDYVITVFNVNPDGLGNGNMVAGECIRQFPELFVEVPLTEMPQAGDILSLYGSPYSDGIIYGHAVIVSGVQGNTVNFFEQWSDSGTVHSNSLVYPGSGSKKVLKIARPRALTKSGE